MDVNDRRLRFLDAMGIQAWGPRDAQVNGPDVSGRANVSVSHFKTSDADSRVDEDSVNLPHAGSLASVESLGWDALIASVEVCKQCVLHKGRTQTVFGTGNREAQWLVVGEGPGADEDARGEPFVGRAGQLLNAMIRAVGAKREQLYITNIVKCRPPSNRNPRADEASCCAPFLQRQIELIRPRLILAVGRVAANNLLGNEKTLGALRGQVYEFSAAKIPVIVTYHPAYLLRKPSDKAKSWQDLQLAMSVAPPLNG